ncbi:MAG: ECF-type sigma factor [Wenzhouxiangella sp.]|jgi:RNA polymerase sigma factor (TIGR02999 family)|nr:ECF-type sigma factor [Wenzhouxiangella sp.]
MPIAQENDMAGTQEITRLLRYWQEGDQEACEELMTLVYQRLHQLADSQLARERSGHTLQPTALVNEAFLNLDANEIEWQDRNHFYALAAQVMRHLLVDHARSRSRIKRGGNLVRVDLETSQASVSGPSIEMLAFDQALDDLAENNARTARVLELTYFGGLTQDAIASLVGVSRRTVDRDLKLGRAWLRTRLKADD